MARLSLAALLLVPVSLAAQAEAPRRTWEQLVRDVQPDRSVRVELASGAVRLGRFVAADDSSLVVRVRSGARHTRFARESVRRVGVRGPSRSGTGALLGTALGLVASTLYFYVVRDPAELSFDGVSLAPFYVLFFTGVGAGAGAIVGAASVEYDHYEAR